MVTGQLLIVFVAFRRTRGEYQALDLVGSDCYENILYSDLSGMKWEEQVDGSIPFGISPQ